MGTIIRQNDYAPRLPDFRNLGVILRLVLAVNAFGFVAAVVQSPELRSLIPNWLETTALVEPLLIIELVLLYTLAAAFSRWSYYRGAAVAVALCVIAAEFMFQVYTRAWPNMIEGHWRFLVLTLVVVLTLIAYFNLRARALSPALAEARLQALQARIRPHFLFNSINAVLSLVRSEPQRAEVALQDLAELFRVLMADNRELKPLGDEVALCKQYLDLEKLRLGDRLQVTWHIENMPERALVPPLVLQPLLENAVYHGIEPSETPGEVEINIFLRRGEVHAVLTNPYRQTSNRRSGNKMAVDNIRERLALHFDAEARLQTKIAQDSYQVHITLPYREVPAVKAGQKNQ